MLQSFHPAADCYFANSGKQPVIYLGHRHTYAYMVQSCECKCPSLFLYVMSKKLIMLRAHQGLRLSAIRVGLQVRPDEGSAGKLVELQHKLQYLQSCNESLLREKIKHCAAAAAAATAPYVSTHWMAHVKNGRSWGQAIDAALNDNENLREADIWHKLDSLLLECYTLEDMLRSKKHDLAIMDARLAAIAFDSQPGLQFA